LRRFIVRRSLPRTHERINILKNIFESGELQEEVVVAKIETTTQHGAIEGKTQTTESNFYHLDAIISVGYRVNSVQATRFRQ